MNKNMYKSSNELVSMYVAMIIERGMLFQTYYDDVT